jgi:hypothetical protein
MRKPGLSKSRILAHRQCPRRLWLQTYRPELAEETGVARLAAGEHVGEVARRLYPDGVLIDGEDLGQALRETQHWLRQPPRPLFEATLQTDGVLIRADLLLPDGDVWRAVEVKSSTSVKDYHLTDAAVQAWVLHESELPVSRIEIAHIDRDFVYPGGGDYKGLFRHVDVTATTDDLRALVPDWVNAARCTLTGPDPQTPRGPQCRDPFDCPFLEHCMPPLADGVIPPEILPRGSSLAAVLRADGYEDLRDVPADRLSNWRHQRVWQATRDDQPVLDAEARRTLAGLGWPRHSIDFETIQFAVPIWPGTRPYDQVPFQWSCHREDASGAVAEQGFLAESNADPRRAFAESLLAALGDFGPILVWNAAFERTRLRELGAAYPDLAPGLHAAISRIFDLLPLARAHYYHPDMRGSWSIKAVLPTIAPELSYDGLEVADGGMAQEAFLELLHPETPTPRSAVLREALLRYCERDTWAMVRIARHFEGR